MKNPKWREAYPQGKKVKYGGKFLTTWSGYSLDLIQTNGGTISANKNRGYEDDQVNLSYTANGDYYFNGWSASKGSINGNTYTFANGDASAKGEFVNAGPQHSLHITFNSAASTDKAYRVNNRDTGYIDNVTGSNVSANHGTFVSGNPIICLHFKFKADPINLQDAFYGMTTHASAWRKVWDSSMNSWQLDQSGPDDSIPEPYTDPTRISANYIPMLSVWLPKTSATVYNDPNKSIKIGNQIYANSQDWYLKENDVKYFIRHVTGADTNHDWDRTTFVSAYYNNEFICSAWEGVYSTIYYKYLAAGGMYSANGQTHSAGYKLNGETYVTYYNDYDAAPGTAKYDFGAFYKDDVDKAYQWLMAQN